MERRGVSDSAVEREKEKEKKKNYTFIQSRYLDACSFLRAIMLQLRGDWFYDCRYKTGKIYGYLDTGVTIARDIYCLYALINDRFPLRISQLRLRHFATTFFFILMHRPIIRLGYWRLDHHFRHRVHFDNSWNQTR